MKQAVKKNSTTKPSRKRILVAALAVLLVAAACAGAWLCFGERDDLNKVVADTIELYRDTKTGAVYRILPNSYEPKSRGEEYARLDMDGVAFVLHEIPGLAPERFLSSTYNDVYCPEDYEPVALADMDVSVLHVCTNTNLIVDALTIKSDVYMPAELCEVLFEQLKTAYREGESLPYSPLVEVESSYTLRFESPDLPGLYFSIKMIRYAEDVIVDDMS